MSEKYGEVKKILEGTPQPFIGFVYPISGSMKKYWIKGTVKNAALFIGTVGLSAKRIIICDGKGKLVTTQGWFLNECRIKSLRLELLDTLIPLQLGDDHETAEYVSDEDAKTYFAEKEKERAAQ